MFWAFVAAVSAAGLGLPPGEPVERWADALALARLEACVGSEACSLTVRIDGAAWVLRVAGTTREARVLAPTTSRGREDVALLAASLLRSGPTVALPAAIVRGDESSPSWGGGASPPATPPRASGGPVAAPDRAARAASSAVTPSKPAVPTETRGRSAAAAKGAAPAAAGGDAPAADAAPAARGALAADAAPLANAAPPDDATPAVDAPAGNAARAEPAGVAANPSEPAADFAPSADALRIADIAPPVAPTASTPTAPNASPPTGTSDGPPWLADGPAATGRGDPPAASPTGSAPTASAAPSSGAATSAAPAPAPRTSAALEPAAPADAQAPIVEPAATPLPTARAPHLAAFAGVNVHARAGLPAAPGARVGGAVRLATPGPAIDLVVTVGGTLPAEPALGVGSLGSASGAVAVELRGEGRLGPFAAIGPVVTTFVFDADASGAAEPQVGVTPGLAARAGAGWPLAGDVRIELVLEGGADLRGVVLARGDEVVGRVGALWAGGGAFLRFR